LEAKLVNEMTVVVVGGAGAMGRWASRSIARLGSARRLLIADRNAAYAERLAAEIGNPCEPVELDARDGDALRATFAGADVVCNTMGPFSLFGTRVLRAALESGCHYLDIDDDWESTVEAFELDDLARRQGRLGLVGIGSSPGTSNLLALLAAARLDEVDALYTGWSLRGAVAEHEPEYAPSAPASAAVEHWLLQCSGTIRVWDDGGERDVRPVERLTLDFPGIGPAPAYTMGHPEPVTLPRSVPGLTRSYNLQTGPDWLFDHVRAVSADYDAGRISLREGALALENPPRPDGVGRTRETTPPIWALAEGAKGGRATSAMVSMEDEMPGRMGGNTGVPLAIAVELLRRGRIEATGVRAPEEVIDPIEFFALYGTFLEPARTAEDCFAVAVAPREP
jgi:saccharopine dehydrogenase (NAD+, L-lysine forming)